MTFWQHLNNILYKKVDIDMNVDELTEYNAFSVNRWASMHSPETAWLINETYNKLWDIFTTQEERYRFQMAVIPRLKFKRINYIKKIKKSPKNTEDKEIAERIKLLSNSLELSQKEIKSLLAYEHEKSL